MKDPLQPDLTPYEVLGVERGAGKAEIERAFMAALQRRVPAPVAKQARDTLLDPAKRAWFEVRQYRDEEVRDLSPSPLENGSVHLGLERRAATAASWEDGLRQRFPDMKASHSLAVLWIWWAIHEEGRVAALLNAAGDAARTLSCTNSDLKQGLLRLVGQADGIACDPTQGPHCSQANCRWREDCVAAAPPLGQIWENAIGYWVALHATTDFWNSLFKADKSSVRGVRERCIDSVRTAILDANQRYSRMSGAASDEENKGTPASLLRELFCELEIALSTELKTAEAMTAANVRMKVGTNAKPAAAMTVPNVRRNTRPVQCGTLLLRHLGLLDKVRGKVDEALRYKPRDRNLRALREALSTYSFITVLLDKRKPREALAAIKRLPHDERNSAEVRRLAARALHLRGKEQDSLDRFEEALRSWGKALECGGDEDTEREIRGAVVSGCCMRSAKLRRGKQLDEAIAILEKGLALADDKNLRVARGELLNQRAVQSFEELHKRAKRQNGGLRREDLPELKRILTNLEQAVTSGFAAAKNNAQAVRNAIQAAESGLTNLGEEARTCMERANEAAGRQDWDEAIENLRRALDIAGANAPEQLKKNLAISLTNRGITKINEGLTALQNESKERKSVFDEIFGKGQTSLVGGPSCAKCGTGLYGTSVATISSQDGRQAVLCGACASELQSMQGPPEPSTAVISQLLGGEQDLRDAVELDPTNEHARSQLKQVGQVLSSFGHAPSPPSRARTRVSRPVVPATTRPRKPASRLKTPTHHSTQRRRNPTGATPVLGRKDGRMSGLKKTMMLLLFLGLLWVVRTSIVSFLQVYLGF